MIAIKGLDKFLCICFAVIICCIIAKAVVYKTTNNDTKITIVTSFYPMYTIATNIAENINDISVTNLTASNTGCLHDYQITTQDMVKLSKADALVVNGDGMENFIDKALSKYNNLKIVNASENIKENHEELLENEEHNEIHHNEDEHHHDHGLNSHYWVSISLYIEQVKNVERQLVEYYPMYKDSFEKNAEKYIEKLNVLKNKMHDVIDYADSEKNIVTFHEAFDYFAEEFGLNVVAVIEREPGTYPSAKDVAEIIDLVRDDDVDAIFVEPQYSRTAADTISKETGVSVYTLDPVVTGDLDKDAYINIMTENLNALKEALY